MVHYTYQETIEVAGPDDIGAKTAFVQTFITRDRYDRMRRDARVRFPGLTERDSQQLFLRPAFTYSGGASHALIVVGMSGHHPDQEHVVGACRQFLQEELSALGRTSNLQSRAEDAGADGLDQRVESDTDPGRRTETLRATLFGGQVTPIRPLHSGVPVSARRGRSRGP
jgi:hypothetical protein